MLIVVAATVLFKIQLPLAPAWELFHRLTLEETERYLDKRVAQGFNVIQAVALAELDGLRRPNANGHYPLLQGPGDDFADAEPDLRGEQNYWTHVDQVLDMAEARGLYVAFLPTWGDKWDRMGRVGPEIFHKENAYTFASFLAERYCKRPNIIWVLMGDRRPYKRRHFEVLDALARGIRDHADPHQLITAHPGSNQHSSTYLHEEEWLDFNMIQSAHYGLNHPSYEYVAKDRALTPVRPTLDAEPCYEDLPVSFEPANGYFYAFDVRQGCYWAVLAGGLGVTYGHHAVWSINTEQSPDCPVTWQDALDRPGARQMGYLRAVMERVDFQTGEPRQDLLQTALTGANYTPVFAGEGFLLAYSPNGLGFTLDREGLKALLVDKTTGQWMNPRTGEYRDAGDVTERFLPPSAGRNNDSVLMLKQQ